MRPVMMDDLERIVTLFKIQETEHHGRPTITLDRQRREWESPGFDLAKSARAVFRPDGTAVGYVEIWDTHSVPVRPHLWIYVHPDHRSSDIGLQLGEWAIQRARDVFNRVPNDARVALDTSAMSTDIERQRLLHDLGFERAGHSWWHMSVTLTASPTKPHWPDGITVTTMKQHDDIEAVYHAKVESFRDHRGFIEEDADEGLARWRSRLDDPKFDPELYFLAMDGDQIVGLSLCQAQGSIDPDEAYIRTVGVVKSHRRRGIAKALLLHTFNAFYQRGQRKIGLHVDGSSLTGATKLYESVGMSQITAHDAYELELRPGRELSKQS